MRRYEQGVWSRRQRELQRWVSATPAGPVKHLVGGPKGARQTVKAVKRRLETLRRMDAPARALEVLARINRRHGF